MTAPTEGSEARINAFYDKYGACWGVIAYSGQEDEKHDGGLYATMREASEARAGGYDPDEIEDMDVCIARWDREGEFWTYDY